MGEVDGPHVVGAGENDDGKWVETGLGAQPGKESVTAHAWQVEIEKEQGGQGVLNAVLVFVFAREVSDGFLRGGNKPDGIRNICFGEGAAEQDSVGRVIFDHENCSLIFHSPFSPAFCLGQWNMKRGKSQPRKNLGWATSELRTAGISSLPQKVPNRRVGLGQRNRAGSIARRQQGFFASLGLASAVEWN